MRFSLGTAKVLGLANIKVDAPPTTAYLMTEGKCTGNCGFCPQASGATSRADLLSRVTWPEFEEAEATCALSGTKAVKRLCIQVVNATGWRSRVREFLARLDPSTVPPICLSCRPKNVAEIGEWLSLGVERVGIPLDAATPAVYREVKSGDWHKTFDLLMAASSAYPGRISTHLIVGLGETEREMTSLMERLYEAGVTVGLFAFTPVKGTRLAELDPPDLAAYRRLQAARYLLALSHGNGASSPKPRFTYDDGSRIIDFGLPRGVLFGALLDGKAFETSGCPDCNRPYYNERPGGVMYNYPRPLTEEEAKRAVADMELKPVWRLLDTGHQTGAWNMAVDEAVMESVGRSEAPPTIRLYGWDPPALSLGYFQDRASEVNLDGCAARGVDCVRRPTGGRAVLHDDEVTYSIVVREDDPLIPSGVTESYRVLSEGIRLALVSLSVPVEMVAADGGVAGRGAMAQGPELVKLKSAACFDAPSAYELAVSGKKIVGSAQVRKDGTVLQHGSILIGVDFDKLVGTLAAPSEAARLRLRDSLARRATAIADVLGARPGWEEISLALVRGWEESLQVHLVPGELSAAERAEASRLVTEKYGTEDWNATRPGGSHGRGQLRSSRAADDRGAGDPALSGTS